LDANEVVERLDDVDHETRRYVVVADGWLAHTCSALKTDMRPAISRERGARGVSVRLWVESLGAFVTLGLAILTVFVPDWIEVVFRFSPDSGNGAVEGLVVLGLAAISVGLTVAARHEWQQLRLAA
jgi:hypothetical protein